MSAIHAKTRLRFKDQKEGLSLGTIIEAFVEP